MGNGRGMKGTEMLWRKRKNFDGTAREAMMRELRNKWREWLDDEGMKERNTKRTIERRQKE